jgi:hypothetical protein
MFCTSLWLILILKIEWLVYTSAFFPESTLMCSLGLLRYSSDFIPKTASSGWMLESGESLLSVKSKLKFCVSFMSVAVFNVLNLLHYKYEGLCKLESLIKCCVTTFTSDTSLKKINKTGT